VFFDVRQTIELAEKSVEARKTEKSVRVFFPGRLGGLGETDLQLRSPVAISGQAGASCGSGQGKDLT